MAQLIKLMLALLAILIRWEVQLLAVLLLIQHFAIASWKAKDDGMST